MSCPVSTVKMNASLGFGDSIAMPGVRTKEARLIIPGLKKAFQFTIYVSSKKVYIMASFPTSRLKCPAIPNPKSSEKNTISQRDYFERKVL